LREFHTVETDTEKARDANVEVTAGFENRWTDDDLSCRKLTMVQEKAYTDTYTLIYLGYYQVFKLLPSICLSVCVVFFFFSFILRVYVLCYVSYTLCVKIKLLSSPQHLWVPCIFCRQTKSLEFTA